METIKLYEQDRMLDCCEAKVLACEEKGDLFEVVLDRTVFFPEGGGQRSDIGRINGGEVTHAAERDGVIYHLCERAFSVGEEVIVRIDWQTRCDYTEQHTGEHLLSAAFWQLFGAKNIGFHMSADLVTIDLDREFSREELASAEALANSWIRQNRPVRIYYREESELAELNMRKVTDKATGLLRVVDIDGADLCTCCGTHVDAAGGVGVVKILRAERYKGGMRIEFLCGRWAFEHFVREHDILSGMANELTTKTENLPEMLKKLKTENHELDMKLRANSARLMDYTARELLSAATEKDGATVCCAAADYTPSEAKLLLAKLTANRNTVAAVFYPSGGRLCYMIGRSEDSAANVRDICAMANGLINGKGGGSDLLAQGAGKLTPDWKELVASLEQAVSRTL